MLLRVVDRPNKHKRNAFAAVVVRFFPKVPIGLWEAFLSVADVFSLRKNSVCTRLDVISVQTGSVLEGKNANSR